jgi:predicted acylesterase/phospholipase RssA
VTFAEAFSMTRRTVNITITSVSKYVPSIILNHKSTPDVIIWSAILASSAMPNIIQPVELLAKDREGRIRPFHVHGKTWTDGTIKNDIPVKEIAAMHNANFFIVSQVNPHLIPFFYSSRGSTGRPTLYSPGSGYRGGFILSTLEKLLKLDMKKCQQHSNSSRPRRHQHQHQRRPDFVLLLLLSVQGCSCCLSWTCCRWCSALTGATSSCSR